MNKVVKLFTKGMLLEALFNPRGMQRGGAAWILGDESGAAGEEPLNVNPVLAGYVLGGRICEPDLPSVRRSTLSAALSAVGDRIIWGLLRPLAITASLLAATAGPIPAILVLLVVYNPPELAIRWRSMRRGLGGSAAVLQDLSESGLPRLAGRTARLGAGAAGCLCGYWLAGAALSGPFVRTAALVAGLVAALLLVRGLRPSAWGAPLIALFFALLWMIITQWIPAGGAP